MLVDIKEMLLFCKIFSIFACNMIIIMYLCSQKSS